MSQNIHVGAKVKVISGGRYLGKEGIVKHVYEGNGSARIGGHFPRSANKTEQGFQLEHLKLIEDAPGVVTVDRSEIVEQGPLVPGQLVHAKPSGGQHTHSTPLPTKADDAELASFGVGEGEQSRPFANPVSEIKSVPQCDVGSAPNAAPTSVSAPANGLANRLASRFGPSADTAPHLIVRARAGTGKTTTLVHGVRRVLGLPSDLIPSPQQEAVWIAMEQSKGKIKNGIGFCAFNKSIATELQQRLPQGCEAATLHSLGFKAVKGAFGKVVSVNQYRVSNIISELLQQDVYAIRKEKPVFLRVTEKLVSLCKMNLMEPTTENLVNLISYHDIDTDECSNMNEVYETVPLVLERCKDVRKDNSIDYDDMIWLPVILGLPTMKYGMLLVDEFQDLNRCQQALARMYGDRIIGCGDDRQAIYGFAGADAQSMSRMAEELGATARGCQVLPLTVTRRCGKEIVRKAQEIVPDFEAHDSNPEGIVSSAKYPSKSVKVEDSFMGRTADGDMVLCRCNAPLVSTCFKFLRIGRKAQIQGRDIGQGLISTIKKLKAVSVADLQKRLDLWLQLEQGKENAKRNPSEDKLIAMQDRYDCLCMFMEGTASVDEVIRKIESVFTDNKTNPGVKLASIHKAKGLEADRVFLLQLKKASVPHPMAKTEHAREQEWNLLYVATTRAIHEFVIVTGGDEERRSFDDGE